MNEDKGKDASWTAVLSSLISSTPSWIRGLVLLFLAGAVLIAVVTICMAIFAGREVTMWPPHVAAYVAPEVTNCDSLIKALPDLKATDQKEIEKVRTIIDTHLIKIEQLELQYTQKDANTVYIKSAIDDLKGDINGLNQHLDNELGKIQQLNASVIDGCMHSKR